MNIAALRNEYSLKTLDVDHVNHNPIDQFKKWFEEALEVKAVEANAMNLATVNDSNKPSARVVLLKGVDHGFVFFTNYESRKGQQIAKNPFAALTFFWPELERQVRIEGKLEKIAAAESDEYFSSRPVGSQIGAITSPQSKVIPNKEFLQKRLTEVEQSYKDKIIDRPDHWGGYRLIPNVIEFWQGRPSRLHDRLEFQLDETGNWQINRLAP
ncbi:pyridoxamine 5'-phosphate oxidase [Litoribacter alkaliphilus]|uniref:Pyridoxine/pyridoxamine 5'-phosphate oxidase n=1 Tax=Litoribacter ruber TaxID=702568 RepID=A0AAP2G4J4_9BACT|nr:pyridoxamine 5'-phosphate oxidase [Litoribacter alkaliphilus]MBS9524570.1 pyridoxamine 5'-phosphate oxidase [Litoribacter alkaliphilus]